MKKKIAFLKAASNTFDDLVKHKIAFEDFEEAKDHINRH